jgi:hypothetical protein
MLHRSLRHLSKTSETYLTAASRRTLGRDDWGNRFSMKACSIAAPTGNISNHIGFLELYQCFLHYAFKGLRIVTIIFLIAIVGVESSCVYLALRPPMGLSCQPRVIMMVEKLVEWWLAGETEVLGENLPQCRFVHHKPQMLPGSAPGPRRWEASD